MSAMPPRASRKETHESAYRESAIKKQIEYLQRQLDDMHPENITDVRRFEKKIRESGMNEEAKKEAEKVLNRMKQEGKDGHEYGMLYDYLDFVTSLAWKTEAMKDVDLVEAEKILDEDHYGLKKVKERIIEQLAVMAVESEAVRLDPALRGRSRYRQDQHRAEHRHGRWDVSISASVWAACVTKRRFADTGRTYVGAMPGRIMEGMKRGRNVRIRLWFWTRWTSLFAITTAILPVHCWRFWTRSRIAPSRITI